MQAIHTGTPPAAPVPLLRRLRDETRAHHEALENSLDLTSDGLTPAVYRLRLERFHGFYRPVEQRLSALGGWAEQGLDLEARRKTPLLESDLQALGVALPEALPLCRLLPDLHGVPQGFGCLYVPEGATLGGQVITRRLSQTLGIGPERGARFFYSYGECIPAMWKAFGAALTAYATTP